MEIGDNMYVHLISAKALSVAWHAENWQARIEVGFIEQPLEPLALAPAWSVPESFRRRIPPGRRSSITNNRWGNRK